MDHADSLQLLAVAIKAHPLMLKLFFDERPQTTLNHLDNNTVHQGAPARSRVSHSREAYFAMPFACVWDRRCLFGLWLLRGVYTLPPLYRPLSHHRAARCW